ncbi:uncharacterized protein METZ01_LOCUS8322 [marine metagenome]|uniref:Uncharacterized protein n=1 Tax=marine metagenome TaxID=408172 RepID=A0A381NNS1_9ZZZZ
MPKRSSCKGVSLSIVDIKRMFLLISLRLRKFKPVSFAAAISMSISGFNLSATTILGMDIDEIANQAELIFEGEVLVRETRQNNNTGIINTYVTFQIYDIVKGEFNGDSIELKFMGGTFQEQTVHVSGLTIPSEGEHGIYFVESLNLDLINPLLGWSQGHFIIIARDHEARISTIDHKPVIQVESVVEIPISIKKPRAVIEGNNQVAAGIITEAGPLEIDRALTSDEFKIRIKQLLKN